MDYKKKLKQALGILLLLNIMPVIFVMILSQTELCWFERYMAGVMVDFILISICGFCLLIVWCFKN